MADLLEKPVLISSSSGSGPLCTHCQQLLDETASRIAGAARCPRCDFVQILDEAVVRWPRLIQSLSPEKHKRWSSLRLDRYQILGPIHLGNRVSVVLGRHNRLEEPCVIKIFHGPGNKAASEAREASTVEARAGFNVNHPNVARILDCDCSDGQWFYVSEYVQGIDLERLMGAFGPLPWRQAAELGQQAAEGLAQIHRSGLIHRDIKPSNLILTAGNRIKITDLGLAVVMDGMHASSNGEARISGTPWYMAPEQLTSAPTMDERCDLYGLGAALYHLLTGKSHRADRDLLDLFTHPRDLPITWPESLSGFIPRWLCHAVEMCMAPEPSQRFRSARELAEALTYQVRIERSETTAESMPTADRSLGVVTCPFENLSGNSDDGWIGYAIAEHIESRLIELNGVHVADSRQFLTLLERRGTPQGHAPTRAESLAVAEHIGAGVVIQGSFERQGDALWITAYALWPDQEQPEHLARLSGTMDQAICLKQELAEKVMYRLASGTGLAFRGSASRRGTRSLQANQQYIIGKRAFANGQYEQAIVLAQEAAAIDPEYTEPISFIGACYARLGQYQRALEYHTHHQLIARQHGDVYRMAEALSNIGAMYYYIGKYDLALEFMQRAAGMESELGLMPVLAKNYNNMGFGLLRLSRLDDARDAFLRSIEISKASGDLVALIAPYNGMGGVAFRQAKPDEAREYYGRALTLANEVEDRVNIGVSHMNIGRCACLLGAIDEGRQELTTAVKVLEDTSYWNALGMAHQYLADLYLGTGELDLASVHAERGLEVSERHQNRRMQVTGWEQKARVTLRQGQSETARNFLIRAMELSDDGVRGKNIEEYLCEVASKSTLAIED